MGEPAESETKTETEHERSSSILEKAKSAFTSLYTKRFRKVLPVEKEVKVCVICFEGGGVCRKCCLGVTCDHCYTKNKACPLCQSATRLEKMTGATYMLTQHSEHEECRRCLDPGTRRRCCSNYYCDDCYYAQPNCPSCDEPVGVRGRDGLLGRASVYSIVMGWFILVFFLMCCTAMAVFIAASEAQTPVTVSSFLCNGIFRTCDLSFCVETSKEVAEGTASLGSLYKWKYCDLDSEYKMHGWGCAFDENLYKSSYKTHGYDYCYDTFQPGSYIFEDNFEAWVQPLNFSSNLMKSAKWKRIVNGKSSDECGVALPDGEVGGGFRALKFDGLNERSAETQPLDVSSGGWLEAAVFLSPEGFDEESGDFPLCVSAHQGVVEIHYSTDLGMTWKLLKSFYPWDTVGQFNFAFNKLELPLDAWSSQTSFKFWQPNFVAPEDHWALDNVRVFRYFPTDWHDHVNFKENVKKAHKDLGRAACCFDTARCERRLSSAELASCTDIPGFTEGHYLLRGPEFYILIILFINVCKFIYVSVMNWYIYKSYPFTEEYRGIVKMEWLFKYLPARYRPKRDLTDLINDIHTSARLVGALREEMADKEAEVDEEAEKLKRIEEKERKKRRKAKYKRKLKLGYTEEEAKQDSSDEEEEIRKMEEEAAKDVVLTDDMEKLKRQNVGLLRVPFEIKRDTTWRKVFAGISGGLFLVGFLTMAYLIKPYTISQEVISFGALRSVFTITSNAVGFFAFMCDFKEVYYNWKHVVPMKDEWLPFLTLDLSQEGNAIYIGPYSIKLNEIQEYNAFSKNFAIACSCMFLVGSFPWCMMSLILREMYLPFEVTRILAPTLCFVMGIRAIMGAPFFIKIVFIFHYLFNTNLIIRDEMGRAIDNSKGKLLSYHFTGAFALIFIFVAFLFWIEVSGWAFLAGILIGFVYGKSTGALHSLPVKPWMLLTTLEDGVWLRVKKKQNCPCIYWCAYCTEMHDCEEIFIVYPEENIRFFEMVKTGHIM